MRHLLAVLRSPVTRWGFLLIALTGVAWFIWQNAAGLEHALARLSPTTLVAAVGLSVLYVLATLEAWRQVLRDLGAKIGLRSAVPVFGVSQLGKYIPGGVWNIAAAAELGAQHRIARRQSVAAMTLALLVSIVSGVAIGALGFLVSPAPVFEQWSWVLWVGIPLTILLLPPVMNRVIALAWRMARLEPLETSVSTRGISIVTWWTIAGWLLAGCQVAVLAIGMGAPPTWLTVAQCVGGYALAWCAGFLVVVTPAGAGVRELVLAGCLAGTVDDGAIVAIVLLSRAALTIVDLGLAGVGALDLKLIERRRRRTT